eukprot:5973132-Amphidinium_carterae.1
MAYYVLKIFALLVLGVLGVLVLLCKDVDYKAFCRKVQNPRNAWSNQNLYNTLNTLRLYSSQHRKTVAMVVRVCPVLYASGRQLNFFSLALVFLCCIFSRLSAIVARMAHEDIQYFGSARYAYLLHFVH